MGQGKLQKLLIEAYSDVSFGEDKKKDSFTVLFNPATYQQKYEVKYVEKKGQGTTGTPQKLGEIKPQDYNFEFLFDGTGASGPKIEVHKKIEEFLKITGKMDGDEHRPNYLKIIWGKLLVKCVLKSAQITYTLFKPDGSPMRAKVAAVFSEAIEETLRVAKEGKNSPDLTHLRQVVEGDNLPLMVNRIYGDPCYYLAVARYNNLPATRRLHAGQQLAFPPVADLAPDLIPAGKRV